MKPSFVDPNSPHGQTLEGLLEFLSELRSVEYKCSETFEVLRPAIIISSMAMANLRGGGYIIVGVRKSDDGYIREGISQEHLETFDGDDLQVEVNRFASPPVEILVGLFDHRGLTYLAIAISEFASTPVLCQRDGNWSTGHKIFAGNLYIRPASKVESRRPKDAVELREVLDLAIEKRALELVRMTNRFNAVTGINTIPSDRERYDIELGDASLL